LDKRFRTAASLILGSVVAEREYIMGRYPRQVRDAKLKCIECNAPVVTTVDDSYACVNCGSEPLSVRSDSPTSALDDAASVADD
jgi:Zn finger protein HypA/HybF involved in hydrogenase expression